MLRKKAFSDLLRYSLSPEAVSARDAVDQLLHSPELETSEAGREFMEVYRAMMKNGKEGQL